MLTARRIERCVEALYHTMCLRFVQFVNNIQFVLTAVVLGFERRTYTVNEADGQVELCVNITVPRRQDIGTVTFNLTVETQDGSAGIIATAVLRT